MNEYRFLPHNPSIFALWSAGMLPVICFTMYGFSLVLHQADPIFPYISDSAALRPQSRLFAFLTIIIAITITITGFARYRQVQYLIESIDGSNQKEESQQNNNNSSKQQSKKLPKELQRQKSILHANNFAAVINLYLSMAGVLLIGTYSSRVHLGLHCTGVFFMCLMSASEACMIYICAKLSKYGIESYPTTMFYNWGAQFLSGAATAIFAMASAYYGGLDHATDGAYRLHWTRADGGYSTHVISAAFEWITIHYHSIFMLCLYRRMKGFQHWDRVWPNWVPKERLM